MLRLISKFIYFKLLGWKISGFKDFNSVKKAVIIAVPHTSWHDFYIGVLLRSVINIKANFIGKKSLFNPLTGWIFKALGGYPVIRKNNEKWPNMSKFGAILEVKEAGPPRNHDGLFTMLVFEPTRRNAQGP